MQKSKLNQTSTLDFIPTGPGIVVCNATNSQGQSVVKSNVTVHDLKEEFVIWSANESPIAIGDNVSVICAASAYKYSTLSWYKDDALVVIKNSMTYHLLKKRKNTFDHAFSFPDIQLISNSTAYSHQVEIRWNSITNASTGNYVCRAEENKKSIIKEKSWQLELVEPKQPEIVESNLKSEEAMFFSEKDTVQLACKSIGIPRPKITWLKNGIEITPETNKRASFGENNAELNFNFTQGDEGSYKCVAKNRIGSASREARLELTSEAHT